MRVSQIVVFSIDDSKTGNATFKSRIDFEGSDGFNCDLTYAHLVRYSNNGVSVKLRVMHQGNWIETSLDFVSDCDFSEERALAQNNYGNR